jgi:HAD superfamily hydrolase (TIGR01509 family)
LKIAVFDLDGVIIDSRVCNYRAFAAGIAAAGLPLPEEDEVVTLIGLPAITMLERLGCPAELSESVYHEVVKPFYLEHLPQLARPVVQARQTLEELRRRGFRIGACTSGDRVTQSRALEALELSQYFEAMQTPDDSNHRKPEPAYLEEVVGQLGGRSLPEGSTVWHVEDSEIGLRMGLEFGATTVFADYGFGHPGPYQPHHRIASLEYLLELV